MSTPIQFGRPFALQRDRDVSGISGTGIVALGIAWPDDSASVRWLGDRPSIVFWNDMADAVAVHGHGGATRVVWVDDEEQSTAADETNLHDRIAYAVACYDLAYFSLQRRYETALAKLRRLADEAQCQTPDYVDGPCHCSVHDPDAHHVPGRRTADNITDDALDALYAERDAFRAELEKRNTSPAAEGEEP